MPLLSAAPIGSFADTTTGPSYKKVVGVCEIHRRNTSRAIATPATITMPACLYLEQQKHALLFCPRRKRQFLRERTWLWMNGAHLPLSGRVWCWWGCGICRVWLLWRSLNGQRLVIVVHVRARVCGPFSYFFRGDFDIYRSLTVVAGEHTHPPMRKYQNVMIVDYYVVS